MAGRSGGSFWNLHWRAHLTDLLFAQDLVLFPLVGGAATGGFVLRRGLREGRGMRASSGGTFEVVGVDRPVDIDGPQVRALLEFGQFGKGG
jgi:hypothetical protein